jgi:hypothetical protein
MKDYVSDFPLAAGAAVDFLNSLPGIDSVQQVLMYPPALSNMWLSKVKNPGVELGDDDLWQIDEREILSFDDYEKILEIGFEPWKDDVMKNRIGDSLNKAGAFFAYQPEAARRLAEAGFPAIGGGFYGSPIESFSGGRTLEQFFLDIYDAPELVSKVFDKAQEHLLNVFIGQLKAAKPIGAWVGGWRAAPDMMAPDVWREYAWKHIKPTALACIELGVIPILHFDSNWDNGIETLKELPPRKCILMIDGMTNIRRARAILDDRMCILGDVPPGLTAFGTPEEVYDYTKKLIDDVGPKTGLIISTGCDTPPNAKHENVDAMIQATIDYSV